MSFKAIGNLLARCPPFRLHYRKFNLPEYQSKILMNEYELAVQDFRIASTLGEAKRIVTTFKPNVYVLKAQIQAGGRRLGHFADGTGSGIQFTSDPQEVPIIVSKMLGNRLITKQTSTDGIVVNEVMVAEAIKLSKERYLAILLDRDSGCPVVVTSLKGGVNIEDTAHNNPEAIFKELIDPHDGMIDAKSEKIALSLGFPLGTEQHKFMCQQIKRLYSLFVELDCLQVEINPLGESEEGVIVNMDAKFSFDSNAAFRQPRVSALAAQSRKLEVDAAGPDSLLAFETSATAHGLNYVGLEGGNIGCMVNGAGLAMATLDIITLHNGKAANFLDLGGKASLADVKYALQTLISDTRVRCILINIFGGIVNCKMVAEGIVSACRHNKPAVPIVVRLEGTNAAEGRDLLRGSGLAIKIVQNMEEAAMVACELAGKQQ